MTVLPDKTAIYYSPINEALDRLPKSMMEQSGSVFYAGRSAFQRPSHLYILGLNPGGNLVSQASETILEDIRHFRSRPARWSAYQDESWRKRPAGTFGMQPRVLHLLKQLELDPREVPASNVVFVRSSTEKTLVANKSELLRSCWPVHAAVIECLHVHTIICFGGTAGKWVREALNVHYPAAQFRERNDRGWTNEAHLGPMGKCVITLTHPGRADWRNPKADPTQLVQQMLDR